MCDNVQRSPAGRAKLRAVREVISTPEAPVLPLLSQGIDGRHEEGPRIEILGCASAPEYTPTKLGRKRRSPPLAFLPVKRRDRSGYRHDFAFQKPKGDLP